MCQFRVSWQAIEQAHGVDPRRRFSEALRELEPLREAGAIRIDECGIEVLPRGRLLVRAVAMAFDRFLKQAPSGARYSRLA